MKAILKKTVPFILGCLTLTAWGQDVKTTETKTSENGQMKTLFSNAKLSIHHLGVYVAPELHYTSLAGQMTPVGGGSVMLLLNKKWGIGASAYTTLDNSFTPTKLSASQALALNAQYAGLKLEYTPNPDALVHVSFPFSVGMGWLNADSAKYVGYRGRGYDFFDFNNRYRNNNFVVIEPGINVEANLFRYAKIFAGASYRISIDGSRNTTTTVNPLANTNFQGLSLNVGLKVGLFDYELRKRKRHKKE